MRARARVGTMVYRNIKRPDKGVLLVNKKQTNEPTHKKINKHTHTHKQTNTNKQTEVVVDTRTLLHEIVVGCTVQRTDQTLPQQDVLRPSLVVWPRVGAERTALRAQRGLQATLSLSRPRRDAREPSEAVGRPTQRPLRTCTRTLLATLRLAPPSLQMLHAA
jgi:hypothetical protein